MISLAEMRHSLDTWWDKANTKHLAEYNSMGVHFALCRMYESFTAEEQKLANGVFAEWLGSDNTVKQWDAWAIISAFRIKETLPQLRKYLDVLLANGTVTALGHAED